MSGFKETQCTFTARGRKGIKNIHVRLEVVAPTEMIQIQHLTGICAGVHTVRVNQEGGLAWECVPDQVRNGGRGDRHREGLG